MGILVLKSIEASLCVCEWGGHLCCAVFAVWLDNSSAIHHFCRQQATLCVCGWVGGCVVRKVTYMYMVYSDR